jgi:RNA polymerase sigma factor (sigma-70 family)
MLDVLTLGKRILRQEALWIRRLSAKLDARFLQAVYHILHCKGTVVVCGMGKAGLVGQKVSATLSSTGSSSHFLHPAEALHGDLGKIKSGDVVLIFSQSGETDEIEAATNRIALREALDTLPQMQRELIILRYFKNLSQQQTAKILDITQVKVSREEKKIFQKLKEIL